MDKGSQLTRVANIQLRFNYLISKRALSLLASSSILRQFLLSLQLVTDIESTRMVVEQRTLIFFSYHSISSFNNEAAYSAYASYELTQLFTEITAAEGRMNLYIASWRLVNISLPKLT